MKQIAFAALGALLLSACVPAEPDTTAPLDDTVTTPPVDTTATPEDGAVPGILDDTCRAARFAENVGQPIDEVTFEGAAKVRVLRPGQIFTEDYLPERLNVGVTRSGVVFRLWCG